MYLQTYQASLPDSNRRTEIKTPVAALQLVCDFKSATLASALEVEGANHTLMASFEAAFNGEMSVSVVSKGGVNKQVVNSKTFPVAAEMFSSVGGDFHFEHVSDDASGDFATWRAYWKLPIADGDLPLGQEMTCILQFSKFENDEFDAVNHISYDGKINIFGMVVGKPARLVYRMLDFVVKNDTTTDIALDGVSVFAVPRDVANLNLFYFSGAKQEMDSDELPAYMRLNTPHRTWAFGVAANYLGYYIMGCNNVRMAQVIAGSTEKAYGLTVENL